MTKWISVKDNPPKKVNREYLVIAQGYSFPVVCEYDGESFRDEYCRNIKAVFWANVPRAPTMEEIYNEMCRMD